MQEVGSGRWWRRRGGNAGAKPELLRRHLPGSAVTHGEKAHPTPLRRAPQLLGAEEAV